MTETASSGLKPVKAGSHLNKLKNVPKQQSSGQTDMNFYNPAVDAGHINLQSATRSALQVQKRLSGTSLASNQSIGLRESHKKINSSTSMH